MSPPKAQPTTLAVDDRHRVSALVITPSSATAGFVFAHGAGAGMSHPFMNAIAVELGEVGIATLRYQFPYMEHLPGSNRSRRPDPPALCHATVRAAVAEAAREWPGLPLIAGGRSFGGRMTSQAQAKSPLPGVLGLAFLGFPLHPAKRPSAERAEHLFDIKLPLLFLQGTRDELAELSLLQRLVEQLGASATLQLTAQANHSFQVPARTGRKNPEIITELVHALRDWSALLVTPATAR